MFRLALKMLIGNRASCLGVIYGVFLATLLVSQQSAIFLGLVARSYRLVTDNPLADIWVIDPATESEEKVRAIPEGYLDLVRGVVGVEWAEPIQFAYLPLVTSSGMFETCKLYGVDEAGWIGLPHRIVEGNIQDMRRNDAVIVDFHSAQTLLANHLPDGSVRPLRVGDSLEINQKRALVAAIGRVTPGFYPQPQLFTSHDKFLYFSGLPANRIQFIAVKAIPGANIDTVIQQIESHVPLKALSKDHFAWRISKSFLQTGILINFGLSVALGILIGFTIAGQVFYIMTLQNRSYFALIKAVGGNQQLLARMVVVQVFLVGAIGYLLGTGATLLWGWAVRDTTLTFLFPWQLLVFTGFIVLTICSFTAGVSLRKMAATDPKMLMGN